jgi:hypothetical protein
VPHTRSGKRVSVGVRGLTSILGGAVRPVLLRLEPVPVGVHLVGLLRGANGEEIRGLRGKGSTSS